MTLQKMLDNNLKKTALLSWAFQLIKIPFTLLTAKLTADVIAMATKGNTISLLYLCAVFMTLVIGMQFFSYETEIIYQKCLSKSLHECKMKLYKQFLSSNPRRLFSERHGELLENLNSDFDAVTGKRTTLYPNFWTSIIIAMTYSIFIAIKSPWLATLLLAFSLLQVIPPLVIKKKVQSHYTKNQEIEAKLTDYIVSAQRGFSLIRLYNLKQWWLNQLSELHKEYLQIGSNSEASYTLETSLTNFIEYVLKYGTYIATAIFVLSKYTTIEVAIQAIALSEPMFQAVKTTFALIPSFCTARISEGRLSQWFTFTDGSGETIETNIIHLSDVSFGYNNHHILEHVSLDLDCNKRVLLKGNNGKGKSTLFRLITGLLTSSAGKITIGNIIPLSLAAENYPNEIFYLPQEEPAFPFTPLELYEMIAPNQISEILDVANKFHLPQNLLSDVKISELSGGERKKVFLCLGFVLNPKIMLLDEPTNSLDATGKEILKQLLLERNGGAIIISHENLLDEIAEEIYVLRERGVDIEKKQ